MKFQDVTQDTPDNQMVFIECDITGKIKKTRYGAAKANVARNNGRYITNWGLTKLNPPGRREDVKKKIKATNLKKYGATTAMNTPDKIEARRNKFKDADFKKQWLEKHRKTAQERYGVDHPMQTAEVQDKQRKVMLEKYGVEHPYQSPEIMAEMKRKNMEKYGVENVAQLPEVQVKMAQTTLERYGVEHYNQLPEMKDYLRENCKAWLAESYAAPWAKGITRPEEWNQKQRETVTMLMMAGTWRAGYPRSHKGFCYPVKCRKDRVYFRSSYEAIYCFYLDNHPDVAWFSFEAFRIPYDFGDKTRYYVPDFLVGWTNGKLSIKELKAEFLRQDEQQLAKQHAGDLFAKAQDMDYELLFNDFIDSLSITFEHLKDIGYVIPEK